MRDLRKVREESEVRFTFAQLYGLLGLGIVSLVLTGLFGYYLGLNAQAATLPPEGTSLQPLIPPELEGESVAQLLALAYERQREGEPLVLDYHELLPETVSARPKRVSGQPKKVELPDESEGDPQGPRELDPERNITGATDSEPSPELDNRESDEEAGGASPGGNPEEGAEVARRYTLQVSSFQSEAQAQTLIEELARKGFDAYRVEASVNGVTWHRVRVGHFEGRDSAAAEMERLAVVRSDLRPMVTVQ